MAPTVSIILPCWNAHAFLKEAVESARAQTWADKEVIVIDDGSTAPETLAALDALPADVRVVHQENRGLAGARNRGFEEARGSFVLPLDCDDWIEPDFIEKAMEATGGDENAFAFAWIAAFGEYEAVLVKRWNLADQLVANQLPYCLLLPKALWARIGGYDETMRLGYEDWDFNIRLGLADARPVVVPEPLFHYRVAAGGMLMSVAHQRHGMLWRTIQKKHPADFSLTGYLAHNRAWSGRPGRFPAWKRVAFWAAHRVLPDAWFAALFRRVIRGSHLRRAAAGQW